MKTIREEEEDRDKQKEEERDIAVVMYERNPGETPFMINICNERNK